MAPNTITIIGDPGHIYNIVKEQRIRIKRGLVEVSGDIENPNAKKKAKSKKEPAEEKKAADIEAKRLADEAKANSEGNGEAGTKEEGAKLENKEEKGGPDSDKESPAKPIAKKKAKKKAKK